MATLLLAEHDNKLLKDATNKALSAAKQMGGDVHVLVAGSGAKGVADAAHLLTGTRPSKTQGVHPRHHWANRGRRVCVGIVA